MDSHHVKKILTLFVFSLVFCKSFSQPILVQDFTPGNEGSFNRSEYKGIKHGDAFIFPITSQTEGTELGYVDESGMKILKDLNNGIESSNPKNFISYNEKVYFTATDAINGSSIWSTNGNAEDTKVEIDLPGNGYPSLMVVSKSGKLYFSYADKLYVYDGTTFTILDDNYSAGDFCTYNDEIAYTKRENNALSIYAIVNGVKIKKGSLASNIGSFASIFGMNQVTAGIIIGVRESGSPTVTATYLISNNNVVSKLFSGETKVALRIEKFDDKRVLAAVNGLGYYALDGTIQGKELFYETTSLSFLQGEDIKNVSFKDKLLFIGNVGGFFGVPKLFYSNGLSTGTEILLNFTNDLNSNLIREGNYAFFATGTSNGFKPDFYAVNLESGSVKKIFSSSLPSVDIESVLMLGVINNRLYFYSRLDLTKGRELYYLNLDFQITGVTDIKQDEDVTIKMYQNEYEILSNTINTVDVNVFTIDGKLLESRSIKTNSRYELPKSNTMNILTLKVNGRTISENYYSN